MLLDMLVQHPRMLANVIQSTPAWVGFLLAGLTVLGLSQVGARNVSLVRLTVTPVVMIGLSVWGMSSAFGSSPVIGDVLMVWALFAALAFMGVALLAPPAGARFDAATNRFHVPGSWVPLGLIMAIFLVKYVVGVDTAMQPALTRDFAYSVTVAAIYGLSSGIFAGRAARLWKLAARPAAGLADAS